VEYSIRPATVADVRATLELWREGDAEPSHTDDEASLTQLIAHDPASLLLADYGGQVVGSVIAAWDGWRGSIYRLVVAPDLRHRGLGYRLLTDAEAHLREAGAVRFQAIVVETDAQAVGFWGASGWERQVERLRYVKG
jgi:ribosomal protein S18 acetylase RimI-like enzyme